ncbi:MAG TPA: DUF2231 domain-containing protein [Bacteroidia bacterium]|jgi:uncharacterized membrane protein|nr:DUF2231 domain-containing protein [Bacteroidia bacterium]
MKVLGHPIHMMLIHFPSALFPMEFVCYCIYYFTGQVSFAQAAFYAMAGGVGLGWVAVLFGAIDLIKIPADKTEVMKKALLHGSINTTVVIIYTVFFYSLYKKYPMLPPASIGLTVTKAGVIGAMIIGNFMGGRLVLKDRIGAEK